MSRITLDQGALSRLRTIKERVEICDESGQVVGYFTPRMYEDIDVPFTEEELQRRAQGTEWYTTEEVLAHLNGLETP